MHYYKLNEKSLFIPKRLVWELGLPVPRNPNTPEKINATEAIEGISEMLRKLGDEEKILEKRKEEILDRVISVISQKNKYLYADFLDKILSVDTSPDMLDAIDAHPNTSYETLQKIAKLREKNDTL